MGPFRGQGNRPLSNLKCIHGSGSDTPDTRFVRTQQCPGSAVARDLLLVIASQTHLEYFAEIAATREIKVNEVSALIVS